MRSLAALVLLSLALSGVSAPLCPPEVQACASAAPLGLQSPLDGDLDDTPWEPVELAASVEARISDPPEVTPARHTLLLQDGRLRRPPRASSL